MRQAKKPKSKTEGFSKARVPFGSVIGHGAFIGYAETLSASKRQRFNNDLKKHWNNLPEFHQGEIHSIMTSYSRAKTYAEKIRVLEHAEESLLEIMNYYKGGKKESLDFFFSWFRNKKFDLVKSKNAVFSPGSSL